jgi:DNA-binding response OmpR family regulator
MLKLLLKAHRIDATCVRSAAEACPLIKTERFDLYMLEGWLPQVDGFEVCRQIRQFDPSRQFFSIRPQPAKPTRGVGFATGENGYVTTRL